MRHSKDFYRRRKSLRATLAKAAGWNDLVLRLQQALEDAPYQMAEDPSEELLREMSRVVEMVGEASPDSVGDIRGAVEELQRLAPDAEWDEVERMLGDLEREGPDSFRGRKSRAGRLARRAEAKARRGTKSGGSVEDLLNELIDALVLAPIDPGASEPEDRDEADRIYNDLVDEIDEVEAAIRSMLDGGTPADTASVERLRSMVQKIERSSLGDFAWWTDVYAAIDAVAREVSGKSAAPLGRKSGRYFQRKGDVITVDFSRRRRDDGDSRRNAARDRLDEVIEEMRDYAMTDSPDVEMMRDTAREMQRIQEEHDGDPEADDIVEVAGELMTMLYNAIRNSKSASAPLAAKSRGAHAVYG